MSDYKDKNWLYQKYIIENISSYQLAKIQNVTISTIRYYLIKFNIKMRNREQSINPNIRYFYKDKDWLFNQYINEKKSLPEIAEICNVSLMPIFNYLKKFNIKIRSQSQAFLEWRKKQIKLGKKYFDLNWLKEKGKVLNIYEIAEICNTNPNRIRAYARDHNIKIKEKKPEWTEKGRKSISESNKGPKNHNWKGGIAEYPKHSQLKTVRLKALKRDKYKCKFCNKKASDVHHVDETKNNHDINNLISVCHKCHINQFHKCKKTTSKYIRKYGMTLQEISNKTKLSPPTILSYFKNKYKPHSKTEDEIHKLLGKLNKQKKKVGVDKSPL